MEKLLQQFFLPAPIMHVTCERFENAASMAKTNVIAPVHFTDDDVKFITAPECLFVKPQSRARELSGFVLVKT